MKQVNSIWRVATIILIVTMLGFTCLFIYGASIDARKSLCANYCYDENYDSFEYNYQKDICSCYQGSQLKEEVQIE